MSSKPDLQFENRFQRVISKIRLTCVSNVIGWTVLALCTFFAIVIGIDFVFETNWSLRAILFFSIVPAVIAIGGFSVFRSRHRWQRGAAASEIENRFKDLGQSIRTSVQLSDGKPHGFSPSLHQALNKEVSLQTQELRLGESVSTGSLKIAVGLLAVLGITIAGFCISSSQWRLAAQRTLLGNSPYTSINVQQGDVLVDEKATFTLNAEIAGRTNRDVVLMTRTKDTADSEWRSRPLTSSDQVKQETQLVSYEVSIPKVKKPFEYQVIAGKYVSPIHLVDVRYPLAIEGFQVELTMPEYTRLPRKIFDKGSFAAVQGTAAKIQIEVDHEPSKAWIEIRPTYSRNNEDVETEIVDLEIDGTQLTMMRDLNVDCVYRVFAELKDGTKLLPNRYQIRVHADRAPRLSFELPEPLIEVHSLAELLMRLRVSDDYGLKRAGIVFQLNNDPEIVLEEMEFDGIITSEENEKPQLQAYLEANLPLEYFEMTVKDSISYYAFAEDNRPGQANRNETDLRFIDVRPFRRLYAIPENNGLAGMRRGTQPNLPALDEMIGRERYAINRTLQLKRSVERGRSIDTTTVDGLISLQNDTSEFAGLLGDRAVAIEERFGIPEDGRISDQMFRAQEAILASVDSLSNAEYEVALLQEKDAVQYLIDARQVLETAAASGKSGGSMVELRKFGRKLFQKMRRPKNDQERVQEITKRLQQAASQQSYLMEKVSDLVPPEMPESEEVEDETEEIAQTEEDEDDQEDIEADDMLAQEQAAEEALAELRDEIEEEQGKLADDVDDIIDMINQLSQVSELAKQRSQKATSLVEEVFEAIANEEIEIAIENGNQASRALVVLSDNIAGVTANEATKRLGIARDLSIELTEDLNELVQEVKAASKTADEVDLKADALAEFESKLASKLSSLGEMNGEVATTVEDILNSILDPEQGILDSEDTMVKRLQKLMVDYKLEEVVERTRSLPELIKTLKWDDASAATRDLADRFDVVSQRLDAMHRELLSPRLEQLRKLEQRAVETRRKLNALESEDQISRWHERADGLVDDVDTAEVAKKQTDHIREAMADSGWGAEVARGWNWELTNSGTTFSAPTEYDSSLVDLIDHIQLHISELSVSGTGVGNGSGVPPKYKHLVERYLDVLAGATDEKEEALE